MHRSSSTPPLIIGRVLIALGITSTLALSGFVRGAEPDTDDFALLLSRVETGRMLLRCGEFSATGEMVVQDIESQRVDRYPVNISASFDFSRKLLRFDRTQPVFYEEPDGKITADVVTTQIASAPELTATFNTSRDRVDLSAIVEDDRTEHNAFDVRCLGLCSWLSFEQGKSFEDLMNGLSKRGPPVTLERDGAGILKLTWDLKKIGLFQRIWIDENRGFVAIKGVIEKRHKEDDSLPPLESTTVEWALENGVWVPTTFNIRLLTQSAIPKGTPRRPTVSSYSLAFDWKTVNSDVPAGRFSYHDFATAISTYVVDWRSGRPIVINHPGP